MKYVNRFRVAPGTRWTSEHPRHSYANYYTVNKANRAQMPLPLLAVNRTITISGD